MDRYNQLFEEIFKQPLSHADNAAMLEKTIADYPYFTPAHFYLLHFTDKTTPAFADQAKKTGLLFNNNYWFNFQLLGLNSFTNQLETERKAAESNNDEVPGTVLQQDFPVSFDSQIPEPVQHVENVISDPAQETPGKVEIETTGGIHAVENESFPAENIEGIPTETTPAVEAILTNDAVEETITAGDGPGTLDEQEPSVNVYSSTPTDNHAVEVAPGLQAEVPVNNEQVSSPATFEPEALPVYTEAEMAENEAAYNETDLPLNAAEDAGMEHVSLKMAETLAGINLDKNTTEETISFEPLHASDYFASVGIKLSEEVKPADKLGLQLKSFTEWLKTMKKVHADQLADTSTSYGIQDKNDKTIQELAEASNKQNEILTEAMADVFQQQGKTGKAIEVYEKLSLLDPSKKVYFAAKIKQLKD